MNASKAKKEASEEKVFLNHQIAHVFSFHNQFVLQYVKTNGVSSILLPSFDQ